MILYQAITQSLVYKQNPEFFQINISQSIDNNTSNDAALTEDDKGLTAVQKLLFSGSYNKLVFLKKTRSHRRCSRTAGNCIINRYKFQKSDQRR